MPLHDEPQSFDATPLHAGAAGVAELLGQARTRGVRVLVLSQDLCCLFERGRS